MGVSSQEGFKCPSDGDFAISVSRTGRSMSRISWITRMLVANLIARPHSKKVIVAIPVFFSSDYVTRPGKLLDSELKQLRLRINQSLADAKDFAPP